MRGRVVIQDTGTRWYLGPGTDWVESCQQARVFEHAYEALLQGLEHQEKTLQVVWCFQNPALNMYIAVRPGEEDCIRPCQYCKLTGSGCSVATAVRETASRTVRA